jgi:hypothetical protein
MSEERLRRGREYGRGQQSSGDQRGGHGRRELSGLLTDRRRHDDEGQSGRL